MAHRTHPRFETSTRATTRPMHAAARATATATALAPRRHHRHRSARLAEPDILGNARKMLAITAAMFAVAVSAEPVAAVEPA